MLNVISDTIIDALKILPFLFFAFLFMEYIEHKLSEKSKKNIEKSGKLGPLIGSILGTIPQCGFSVAATNLYAVRVISLGTLISIYLATSDEMLPILISEKVELKLILLILFIKIIIGIIFGFVIDLFVRQKSEKHIHDICEEEHCGCENGILKSTIKHTLSIFFFLVSIQFILNIGMYYYGENAISNLFLKNSFLGSFITSLVGLIPNCAASVVITELFLKNAITFGSMIAGLLTGSGIALLVLFKENKNIKENISIIFILYVVGSISGIVIDLFVNAFI